MTKSNGIASLKQAAKLLNRHAPDGESLAYINPEEGRVLRARGGSGIMTLAGVPTYGLWDTIVDYGKKALKYINPITELFAGETDQRPANLGDYGGSIAQSYRPPNLGDYGQSMDFMTPNKGNFIKDLAKGAWTGIKERYSDPKNIAGDLGKAWLTVESYKGQKDLNKFEQDKYDRALADIAAGEAEFASNIGAAPLEITNMPTETDIASFTDVTLPSMTTTAVAEGGRIGYNMGGIDTPFQGIGALNPRMGYQDAGEVVEKTFSEEEVKQEFPSDALGAINVNEEQMAIISDMKDKGMDTSLISTISGVDEDTVIRYIRTLNAQAQGGRIGYANGTPEIPEGFLEDLKRKNLHKKLEEYLKRKEEYERRKNLATTQEAAQGGRIGAEKGGIMPLLDMGGMEKDYRQDGGFVPIGRKEKADDVPARLSKNEFVFTADAVRAAGGGDIDQGAQRMYNVMKNLEAGGQISQQSQGKR